MSDSTPQDDLGTEAPTIAELLTSYDRRNRSGSAAVAAATSTSRSALHVEEAARTKAFASVLAVLVIVALIFVPFQPVPPWLNAMMAASLVGIAGLCGWVWSRCRDPSRYNITVFRVFGIGCASVALVIVYYGGVFSPAPVAIVLGLSFFALGDDRKFVGAVIGVLIAGYIGLAVAVSIEWIPQHSLVVALDLPGRAEAFAVVVTAVCFAVTVWHARLARQATRDAIGQLSVALVEVQHRESLVNEAHQQLEAAFNLDAGKRGSHTGERAGAHLLGELIGRGAMGEVYSASTNDGETIAVKVLTGRIDGRLASIERFRREARIALQLSSENIVRVIEVGDLQGGYPYIAMELLVGNDLGWKLRRHRRLASSVVVDLVFQVARGLDAAHEAGVVHRDIKPNNLFLDRRRSPPTWKILDFGVARDTKSRGTLTRGAIVGTPGYMAPEQAEGKVTDRRCDIFSLGAVAYRSLTGQPAFSGKSPPETMFRVVHRQPLRPSRLLGLRDENAEAIDATFAIVLAKAPSERFKTAGEFAEALDVATRGVLGDSLRWRAAAILARAPWAVELADT